MGGCLQGVDVNFHALRCLDQVGGETINTSSFVVDSYSADNGFKAWWGVEIRGAAYHGQPAMLKTTQALAICPLSYRLNPIYSLAATEPRCRELLHRTSGCLLCASRTHSVLLNISDRSEPRLITQLLDPTTARTAQ